MIPTPKPQEIFHLDPDAPAPDQSRETAAYERERERLVRDHLGKIALLRGDDVVGVFDDMDQALREGRRRFGWQHMVFRPIVAVEEPPAYISNVDINHPSFRRIN